MTTQAIRIDDYVSWLDNGGRTIGRVEGFAPYSHDQCFAFVTRLNFHGKKYRYHAHICLPWGREPEDSVLVRVRAQSNTLRHPGYASHGSDHILRHMTGTVVTVARSRLEVIARPSREALDLIKRTEEIHGYIADR